MADQTKPVNQADPEYQEYQQYLEYIKTHGPAQQAAAPQYKNITDQFRNDPNLDTVRRTVEGVQSGSVGPGVQAAEAAMSPISNGVRKLGDFLMQRGMGASRIVPGLGEKFAQEGMVGTKNMLAKQAGLGLERSGNKISELASKIPEPVSQDMVANKIAEVGGSKMTPSGFVRPEDEAFVNRTMSKAQDFAKAEPLPASEMASRRAIAGKAAREAGAYKTQPSQQLRAQMASAEQSGYSQALKDAYAKSFPGEANPLAEADQSYSTFKQAQSLLDKPEAVGSIRGFADQFVPSTLMETLAGRAAIGVGKHAPLKAGPAGLTGLLGRIRSGEEK